MNFSLYFARNALILTPRPILQKLIGGWVTFIAQDAPELFDRLGCGVGKCFMIEVTDTPLVLFLTPQEGSSHITVSRTAHLKWDARVAGSLGNLFTLIDGRADADAQFFRRDLVVEGDTEAVVCLRAALDDMEPSPAERIANLYGPLGRAALCVLRQFEKE